MCLVTNKIEDCMTTYYYTILATNFLQITKFIQNVHSGFSIFYCFYIFCQILSPIINVSGCVFLLVAKQVNKRMLLLMFVCLYVTAFIHCTSDHFF